MRREALGLLVLLVAGASTGCQREDPPTFVSNEQVLSLPSELQAEVREALRDYTGTFTNPKLLGDDKVTDETLAKGQQVYQERCVQCHGVSGDGNGPVAGTMYPRPRDYRKGTFKFTSTPYGAKPLFSDLVRTVTMGVRGTSMPSFKFLSPDEIDAVVAYVLVLTHRGELEEQLGMLADFDEEVDREIVEEETLPIILSKWKDSAGSEVTPVTPQPVFTIDHVRRGKEAFLSKGCSKCHGDDGRGQTPDNLAGNLKDTWGHVTRAADLTSGLLHGGAEPIAIYRRIYSGINGTPMPSFAQSLREEPDTIWDLVAYVRYVASRRRAGVQYSPGTIAPYVKEEAATGE